MKVIDLTGKRFGRLEVIKKVGISKDGQKIYLCRCDCGREKEIRSGNLRSGHTISCGCANVERIRKQNKEGIIHGGCGTRLYTIWRDMKNRCGNKNTINWNLYGGRGIKVCEEWKNDFARFREWAVANGYNDKLQLDRIDNDGNYEPSNCRWANLVEQGNNRRTCKYITIKGVTKTVSEWCEITGVNRNVAYGRISRGWDAERAVTERPKEAKKLSESDVATIRSSYIPRDKECGAVALAKRYSVSVSTIEAIVEGRNWKGVKRIC